MSWKEKKKRMAGAVAAIFIILSALVMCGAGRNTVSGTAEPEKARTEYPKYAGVTEYEVKANDTLLSIAYQMCPEGSPAEVYYRYADAVKRLNGRETDIIYFKETIKIYTFEEEGK